MYIKRSEDGIYIEVPSLNIYDTIRTEDVILGLIAFIYIVVGTIIAPALFITYFGLYGFIPAIPTFISSLAFVGKVISER